MISKFSAPRDFTLKLFVALFAMYRLLFFYTLPYHVVVKFFRHVTVSKQLVDALSKDDIGYHMGFIKISCMPG